ncbi:MAG: DUF4124 domain-containing protein, partial [Methylococcales bacterium]|nr:DUF4124 domain-containing protein [Methylococcales bacterium]
IKYKNIIVILLTSLTLLTFVDPSHAAKRFYKWVDKNGVTRISDHLPPDQVKYKREVKNSSGVTVQTIRRAKTKSQILKEAQKAKENARQRRIQRVNQAKKDKKDRVLLATYSDEDDLISARDEQLSNVDLSIEVLQGSIRRLSKRLTTLQSNADEYVAANRPVPAIIKQQIAALENSVKDNENEIDKKRKYMKKMHNKYAEDLKRFKLLKKGKSK